MSTTKSKLKTIDCYAMSGAKKPLEKSSYEPQALGPHDVEVEITHCGICHSDLHLIKNEWGTSFPLVPGHEIVGLVKDLGSEVKHLNIGTRVGIGWQRSSCHTCKYCLQGKDIFCPEQKATCVGEYGGFASAIRVDSRFAFEIPNDLASENAAPLLCAGATVFSPFYHHNIDGTKSVGIVGIGGLGHIALQFASALGCNVTAISSTASKQKEATSFGANQFILSSDKKAMKKNAASLDFILVTTSTDINWEDYVNLLAPNGTMCIVGAPHVEFHVPLGSLIEFDLNICGSHIASPTVMKKMLEFASRHGIKPQVEVFPMSEVNNVIKKLDANQIRYRAVLKN